jgi:hypothetical protein
VGFWVVLDVLRQVPVGHPIRDKLQGIKCGTYGGYNVLVFQTHPHDNSLAKALPWLVTWTGHPHALHADVSTIEGGLEDVAIASCSERVPMYL